MLYIVHRYYCLESRSHCSAVVCYSSVDEGRPLNHQLLLTEVGYPALVVNDVLADLGEEAVAALKSSGSYARIIGYMCEAHLSGLELDEYDRSVLSGVVQEALTKDPSPSWMMAPAAASEVVVTVATSRSTTLCGLAMFAILVVDRCTTPDLNIGILYAPIVVLSAFICNRNAAAIFASVAVMSVIGDLMLDHALQQYASNPLLHLINRVLDIGAIALAGLFSRVAMSVRRSLSLARAS